MTLTVKKRRRRGLPLGARIVARGTDSSQLAWGVHSDTPKEPLPAARLDWKGLVLLAWEVMAPVPGFPEGKQLTGELPRGVGSHQFWAKVKRAAKRMRGDVGVRVRGECWWVWGIKVPEVRSE